jgi:hypothetical protein
MTRRRVEGNSKLAQGCRYRIERVETSDQWGSVRQNPETYVFFSVGYW